MGDRFPLNGDIVFRMLETSDIPELHALHCEVLRSLQDRRFLNSHDLDYFHSVIEQRGHVIGAYECKQLIGYGAFLKPGEEVAGHGLEMCHLGITPQSISESAGAAVHPACRKQGLFSELIRERFRLGAELGYAFMTSVVSPENLVSLKVLLRMQCIIVANFRDSDGDNYLLLRYLGEQSSCPPNKGSFVELDNWKSHLRILSDRKSFGIAANIEGKLAVEYVDLQGYQLPWLANTGQNFQIPV